MNHINQVNNDENSSMFPCTRADQPDGKSLTKHLLFCISWGSPGYTGPSLLFLYLVLIYGFYYLKGGKNIVELKVEIQTVSS